MCEVSHELPTNKINVTETLTSTYTTEGRRFIHCYANLIILCMKGPVATICPDGGDVVVVAYVCTVR